MKTETKSKKNTVVYNDTNVPGGYCMSGKNLNVKDTKKVTDIIQKIKKDKPKSILDKIFS